VASRQAYLTIDETAATLRVSERTVRRWIAKGTLAVRKLGGTVRVSREALTAASVAVARPRRGRPPRTAVVEVSALSHDVFAKTWDNPGDAVYDRWREIYGVRQG
jgi:excisionase family DNA binding protein